MLLHEIGGILWLTLWRWLHSCRMYILVVECGLMHRGDCINCETCYFCFDPAFVWPRLGRFRSFVLFLLNVLRCFPLLPTPLPYKSWRLRAGLEVEVKPTWRQCRAVWRHRQTAERSCREALGQCRGAVRHWGSSRGPDHQASPTLMADLQLQQQDPVLRPVLVNYMVTVFIRLVIAVV